MDIRPLQILTHVENASHVLMEYRKGYVLQNKPTLSMKICLCTWYLKEQVDKQKCISYKYLKNKSCKFIDYTYTFCYKMLVRLVCIVVYVCIAFRV